MMLEFLKSWFGSNLPGRPVESSPRSSKWPKLRKAWLEKHPTCAACGVNKELIVHHRIPFHVDPLKELDETNLITLCGTQGLGCHFYIGHSCSFFAWNVDVEKDAAIFLKKVKGRSELFDHCLIANQILKICNERPES